MKKKLVKRITTILVILFIVPQVAACTVNNSTGTLQEYNPTDISETIETPTEDSGQTSSFLYSIPNDVHYDKQWALSRIQALEVWQTTSGIQSTVIAILDTGIDVNHEDLKDKVIANINLTNSPTVDDIHGHGTHIAGIIAAASNNGIGIAGLASKSRLMNVKVADDKGRVEATTVAEGIIWAVDNGANVINISLEIREPSPDLEKAINYAWDQGVLIIASASNLNSQILVYPAAYEKSIAVVATKQDDKVGPLSNYIDYVDIAAPGFDIYSTLPDNNYGFMSGTSFATAMVSGLAALLHSVATDTNGNGFINDEVRLAIEDSCEQLTDLASIKGILNATEALMLIK